MGKEFGKRNHKRQIKQEKRIDGGGEGGENFRIGLGESKKAMGKTKRGMVQQISALNATINAKSFAQKSELNIACL